MDAVGIRDLKANLSRHLKRVQKGARLVVTERGRAVASIHPIDDGKDIDWVRALVAAGRAQWGGGKPEGAAPAPRVGRSVSEAVIQDRG